MLCSGIDTPVKVKGSLSLVTTMKPQLLIPGLFVTVTGTVTVVAEVSTFAILKVKPSAAPATNVAGATRETMTAKVSKNIQNL
jgi:hypothetical protein